MEFQLFEMTRNAGNSNLHASVEGNEILHGINLKVNAGEVHAIMGPTVPERARLPRSSPAGRGTW